MNLHIILEFLSLLQPQNMEAAIWKDSMLNIDD